MTEFNRTLANENLSFQPALEEEKKTLAALYAQLDTLEKSFQEKQRELQNKRGFFNLYVPLLPRHLL